MIAPPYPFKRGIPVPQGKRRRCPEADVTAPAVTPGGQGDFSV